MTLRSIFLEPPKQTTPAFRYGLLVFMLALLFGACLDIATTSPSHRGERYSVPVLLLVVLFHYLAFAFSWPPRIMLAMRIMAVSWLAFGAFYLFYLSRILYPIQ